ncbi:MAG: hypothetical protein HOO06_09630 [Bdellovibrionaceae bacterium]|jgi:hypothetical protein|nr:hypothetical protein [Pseudobdellovibrionaceae bacterium]
MEDSIKNEGIATPKKKVVNNTTPIRVRKATSRTIRTVLNKLNRKQLGRRVTVDDVVAKALTMLTDESLEEVKQSTFSSKDHLELQYQEYCQKNGQVTKEKFLDMLLKAGLPTLKKSPESDS